MSLYKRGVRYLLLVRKGFYNTKKLKQMSKEGYTNYYKRITE